MSKLTKNQTLWFVGSGSFFRERGEVTVLEVGRKWARITGAFKGRIAVDTLMADGAGYSCPGTCYASEEAWLKVEGPRRAWQALRSNMDTACPAGMSFEAIVEAGKLLGIDVDALVKAVR